MDYIREEPLKDPDADLTELLAREFEVNYLRARNVARKISFDEFAENYDTLENIVGNYLAKEIVKNGAFLEYKNGFLDEFLNLSREAINSPKKVKPSNVFYSVDSLKKFLSNPNNGANLDVSKLNFFRNKLFDFSDAQAQAYLDSLIEKGYVSVSIHEHWCKSRDRETGPRSSNILKKIAFLLKMAFADIGLERPGCKINFNTVILEIGEDTRLKLQKIREELRNKQTNSHKK